jgi:glutamate synthase domain-containing protein 3
MTLLLDAAKPAIEKGEKVTIKSPVININRTVGTILSNEVAKRYGQPGLPDDTINIELTGSAGQSLGAFLAHGITIRLSGDANDYVGKGLSGGRIVIAPPPESSFAAEDNILVGNVCLYGATGGEAFLSGRAAERFCVRNSGASTVIEGVGDHGCEYMTGGRVVVLGPTGRNFAAGMSGGIAYVYDPDDVFSLHCNLGMVDLEKLEDADDITELVEMITSHMELTGSAVAHRILNDWDNQVGRFVKVMPIDYRRVLMQQKAKALEAEPEVGHG